MLWLNDPLNDYSIRARLRTCVLPEGPSALGVMCSSELEVRASLAISYYPAAIEWLRQRRAGPAVFRSVWLMAHAMDVARHGDDWWAHKGDADKEAFWRAEDCSEAYFARCVWRPPNPEEPLEGFYPARQDWLRDNQPVLKFGVYCSWCCVPGVDTEDEAMRWVRRLAEARVGRLLHQWMGWARECIRDGRRRDVRDAIDAIAEVAELVEPGRLRELLGEAAA